MYSNHNQLVMCLGNMHNGPMKNVNARVLKMIIKVSPQRCRMRRRTNDHLSLVLYNFSHLKAILYSLSKELYSSLLVEYGARNCKLFECVNYQIIYMGVILSLGRTLQQFIVDLLVVVARKLRQMLRMFPIMRSLLRGN